MEQPIVVNSVLCYLQNTIGRENAADLVTKYFKESEVEAAKNILLSLINSNDFINNSDIRSDRQDDIVLLFKKFSRLGFAESSQKPVFAIVDLFSFPKAALKFDHYMEVEAAKLDNIINELKQIRKFIEVESSKSTSPSDLISPKRINIRCSSELKEHDDFSKLVLNASSEASKEFQNLSCSSSTSSSSAATISPQISMIEEIIAKNHSLPSIPHQSAPNKTRKIKTSKAGLKLDHCVRKLTDRLVPVKEETVMEVSKNCNSAITQQHKSVSPSSNEQQMYLNRLGESNLFLGNDLLVKTPQQNTFPYLIDQNVNNQSPFMYFNLLNNMAKGMTADQTAQMLSTLNHSSQQQPQEVNSSKTDLGSNDGNDIDFKMDESSPHNISSMSCYPGSPSPSDGSTNDYQIRGVRDIPSDSEKKFECGHMNCNKKFANKFLLKKHQFIHTGLRPHGCPHCQKRFNRKDNLLRHKKTHTQNGSLVDELRTNFSYQLNESDDLANISN
uniref:C2H2-type domain-containing protein n=1 Tax=Rhabditophanes sp. KR3021 TaxID=114890 RepID=A0AC35U5Z0_9BILA